MYSSLYAIAEGISAQEDANTQAQLSTALFAIFLVGGILPLQEAWMKQISEDTQIYLNDTLKVAGPDIPPTPGGDPHKGSGPSMIPVTAMDNQQKSMDTNQSDLETGNENNLVETAKAQEGYLGNSLDQVFRMQEPINELLAQTKSLIMQF